MKHLFSLCCLLLAWGISYSDDEVPTIYKMWSRTEGIQNYVIDVEPDSVSLNFSEKDKWSVSNIKMYGVVAFNINGNDGRLILKRDSMGIEHYRAIDIYGLTYDSLKIFLHPQYFADAEQAKNSGESKAVDSKVYYTTEFLYLKKVEEKAPSLKKSDYIAFLNDANAEAKKRAKANTLNMNPKITIDKRVDEFLFEFAKEKQYRGKIFPATLARAMKANEKDANIIKLKAAIKTNFVVRKTAETVAPAKGTAKPVGGSKTTAPAKEKPSNDLIIKTEKKK